MTFEIATDIGGTFTDLYLRDADGRTASFKTSTTPADYTEGVMNALSKAAEAYGRSTEELLGDTERFVHGTTIATNAILEDATARTALICTDGFRDVLTFREGGKENPYDWDVDYPEPNVPRSLTFEVDERVNAEGDIVDPLDESSVYSAIERAERAGVEAIAVALLWAHVNPTHEERIADLLDEHADVPYSLSHRVNPIIREYRRTVSTTVDASLHTLVDEYVTDLDATLRANGYTGDPLIITANGGVMGAEEVARTPIWAVDSGPTMLPVVAREYVSDELGKQNVIALDVGGTSFDVGLVLDGDIPRTREAKVGDDILGIDKVDVRSLGSGGGSIARVDEGGMIHVGPESAGADPGPACYGRGGTDPTVTDAALLLGYLDPGYFLGGEMSIDPEAAEEAFEGIAAALGTGVREAAYAVYATANQNIANGIKRATIERGIDPRKFVLSGGGGAFGMHVVPVARELEIDDILLPRGAGVVSAIGGSISDLRRDFSASRFVVSDDFDYDGVNETLEDLERKGRAFLERADVPPERRQLDFYAEARYPRQVWELQIELPAGRLETGDASGLEERFHEVHEQTYGYRDEGQPIEVLYWRVEATGVVEASVGASDIDVSAHSESRTRSAYFDGSVTDASAYRASGLAPGTTISGPALVDGDNTTVVLPPGSALTVTTDGNFHIRP